MKYLKYIKQLVLASIMVLALPVMAMNLQEAMSELGSAKNQGMVGEQPDGYLGVVAPSEKAVGIVKLINDARRNQYQRLAKENNLAVGDVEAMAGQKAIEKTQSGHFIQVNDKWAKKP